MQIFRKKKKRVELKHYAPDFTVTAVDYEPLVSEKRRQEIAETRIRKFLTQTNPDAFCEAFYDEVVHRESALLIAQLDCQKTDHMNANQDIVSKHAGELVRLKMEIERVEKRINELDEKICGRQQKYNEYNGGI